MSDTFFKEAEDIASSKRAAKNSGRNLVRWQDVGVFFPPDTPAAIRNKLCVHKPSEAEWEKIVLARYENEKSPSPEKPKAGAVTINRGS